MQYRSSFREKHNNTEKKHAGFSFYILQWFAQFLFGWLHQVVLFLKNSNRLKKKTLQKKIASEKKSGKGKEVYDWLVI